MSLTYEADAGDGQLIVVYMSHDYGEVVEPQALVNELAQDSVERLARGWYPRSVASMPLRQMGTAGNILFQSGGQYVTQVALLVLYSRQAADRS